MTQNVSYAQARISFYEARFQSETNDQLVNEFNTLAASRGWTAERSYFSSALIGELKRRGINLSAITQSKPNDKLSSISFQPVRYDKERHALTLAD